MGIHSWHAIYAHLVGEGLENINLGVDLSLFSISNAIHVHLAPCNFNALLLVVPFEDCLEGAVPKLLIELSDAHRKSDTRSVSTGLFAHMPWGVCGTHICRARAHPRITAIGGTLHDSIALVVIVPSHGCPLWRAIRWV